MSVSEIFERTQIRLPYAKLGINKPVTRMTKTNKTTFKYE